MNSNPKETKCFFLLCKHKMFLKQDSTITFWLWQYKWTTYINLLLPSFEVFWYVSYGWGCFIWKIESLTKQFKKMGRIRCCGYSSSNKRGDQMQKIPPAPEIIYHLTLEEKCLHFWGYFFLCKSSIRFISTIVQYYCNFVILVLATTVLEEAREQKTNSIDHHQSENKKK